VALWFDDDFSEILGIFAPTIFSLLQY